MDKRKNDFRNAQCANHSELKETHEKINMRDNRNENNLRNAQNNYKNDLGDLQNKVLRNGR